MKSEGKHEIHISVNQTDDDFQTDIMFWEKNLFLKPKSLVERVMMDIASKELQSSPLVTFCATVQSCLG